MEGHTHTLIIGIGNEYRSDDAAGILVARALAEHRLPGVQILEKPDPGVGMIEWMEGADTVILVDAASSGSPPGTIHRFDASLQMLPEKIFAYSTHAMGVSQAIELARTLRRMPARLIVYGIEGADFSPGCGLSEGLPRAIEETVRKILEEITPP